MLERNWKLDKLCDMFCVEQISYILSKPIPRGNKMDGFVWVDEDKMKLHAPDTVIRAIIFDPSNLNFIWIWSFLLCLELNYSGGK